MNMSINISMNSTARECMDSNWFNRLSLRVSMNWKEESEEDGWSRKGEMKFNNLYISVRVVRVCVFFISPVVFFFSLFFFGLLLVPSFSSRACCWCGGERQQEMVDDRTTTHKKITGELLLDN